MIPHDWEAEEQSQTSSADSKAPIVPTHASCYPRCLRGLQPLASHQSFCSLPQPCPVQGIRAFILGFEGSCVGGWLLIQSSLRTSVSSYQAWKEGLCLLLFSYFVYWYARKPQVNSRVPTQPHTNVLQNLLGFGRELTYSRCTVRNRLPRPVHPPEVARPVPPHCPENTQLQDPTNNWLGCSALSLIPLPSGNDEKQHAQLLSGNSLGTQTWRTPLWSNETSMSREEVV